MISVFYSLLYHIYIVFSCLDFQEQVRTLFVLSTFSLFLMNFAILVFSGPYQVALIGAAGMWFLESIFFFAFSKQKGEFGTNVLACSFALIGFGVLFVWAVELAMAAFMLASAVLFTWFSIEDGIFGQSSFLIILFRKRLKEGIDHVNDRFVK